MGIVPIIEPPLKLVKIGIKMFSGDLMIRTDNRSLEERPNALNRVGVNIATYPFLNRMVDSVMLSICISHALISRKLVGVNVLGLIGKAFFYESVQCCSIGMADDSQPDIAGERDPSITGSFGAT